MRTIALSRVLPYPRAMVWDALVDPDQLGAWLMPNDFRPVLGHAFTFHTDPAPGFDGIVQARVLELDPPTRLAFTWRGGPLDTIVRFTLTEVEGGTRLDLEHEGFSGFSNLLPRIVLGFGWRGLLSKKLPAYLALRKDAPGRSGDGAEGVAPTRAPTNADDDGGDD